MDTFRRQSTYVLQDDAMFSELTVHEQISIPAVLFFISINQSLSAVFGVLFQFTLERSVITRQCASKSYSAFSYYVSKALIDFIRGIIFVVIYSIIISSLIGLRPTADAFFKFNLALFIMPNLSESMAFCIAIVSRDPQIACALMPIPLAMSIDFAGFSIRPAILPNWMAWFRWFSFIQYGFNALGQNQFPDGFKDPIPGTAIFNELSCWENIAALAGLNIIVKTLG